MSKQVDVLGVPIDAITITAAIEIIVSQAKKSPAKHVMKPYVEFFDGIHEDLMHQAWLCLPDGVALQWAAYFQSTGGGRWQLIKTLSQIILSPGRLSKFIPERFSGINFTWPLLEACSKHKLQVFLVGSPENNHISETAKHLNQLLPELRIVGTLPGRDKSTNTFSVKLEAELIKALNRTKPDIILIGIGFPQQDQLIERLIKHVDHGVFIGEGGTFDYQLFGGKIAKAPKILQRIGLEWLWRLVLSPKRLGRQLAIPRFIRRVYAFTTTHSAEYDKDNKQSESVKD